MNDSLQRPSFTAALRFWFKLGWISFGGTAAHIAIMHSELVEKKRWISNGRFLHALSHCMILPGPEARQLAIYIGWVLHGKRGGIAAGTLFVLPSMFILLALSDFPNPGNTMLPQNHKGAAKKFNKDSKLDRSIM